MGEATAAEAAMEEAETTMKTTGNLLKILLSPVKSVKKLLVLEFWAQSQWVMLMQQTLQ